MVMLDNIKRMASCSGNPSYSKHECGESYCYYSNSMKHMLVYSSMDQIKYVIIRIIAGDSNDRYASMIIYMFFYIFMNLKTFACIVLFDLRTDTDNIQDYALM